MIPTPRNDGAGGEPPLALSPPMLNYRNRFLSSPLEGAGRYVLYFLQGTGHPSRINKYYEVGVMDANYVQAKPKSGLKTFALVVGIIMFVYVGSVVLFAMDGSMPGYIYRDSLIIGKTEEEIVSIYGEPDERVGRNEFDYKINCIFSAWCHHSIIFKDGVAVEIKRHCKSSL